MGEAHGIGSRDDAMVMKYTHNPGERSWVQFTGTLAMIGWRGIFDSVEAGVELQV